MVKALARAFRWRKLLETKVYGTIEELAAAEKINPSYVSRVLRMTLLAPDIVEAILDGSQPQELTLAGLMRTFPLRWDEQLRFESRGTSASTTVNGERDDG
jgi:hypothetical protein